MPDQTPVTDDDRRNARKWAEGMRDLRLEDPDGYAAARVILDTVPAPPRSLADELRYRATLLYNGDPDGDSAAVISALADRVEAVEKANRDTERELLRAWAERDAAYSENNRVCAALATVTDERNNAWDRLADLQDVREELHAARAEVELLAAQIDRMVETYASEVERLTRERDEASAEVESIRSGLLYDGGCLPPGMTVAEAVEHLARTFDRINPDHLAGAERLTRDRTVKDSRTVALPDPADVPEREVWEVTRVGRRAIGFRRDTGPDYHTWALVYEDGVIGRADDAVITLVSRLVPDTRRVIDRPEDLDALPVGSIVIDKNGNPWKKLHDGLMEGIVMVTNSEGVLNRVGPVTVIHEPEEKK